MMFIAFARTFSLRIKKTIFRIIKVIAIFEIRQQFRVQNMIKCELYFPEFLLYLPVLILQIYCFNITVSIFDY